MSGVSLSLSYFKISTLHTKTLLEQATDSIEVLISVQGGFTVNILFVFTSDESDKFGLCSPQ